MSTLLLVASCNLFEKKQEDLSLYSQITGDPEAQVQNHWNQRLSTTQYVYGKEPAEFVKENLQKLPVGRALDLAMGEGRNAVFLAKKGFDVEGVDISDVALRKALRLAKENKVKIRVAQADLRNYQVRENEYDVILNIQFLERSLVPKMIKGLKKGGVVVFENPIESPGTNPQYLLKKGELQDWFKDFEILVHEEAQQQDVLMGRLVAKKR